MRMRDLAECAPITLRLEPIGLVFDFAIGHSVRSSTNEIFVVVLVVDSTVESVSSQSAH